MKIDHIAVYVTNLELMRDFYKTYFEAESGEGYHNPKTGLKTYFLSFKGKARLELMCRPEAASRLNEPYALGYTHLSFQLESREHVNTLTNRLEANGFTVLSQPRVTGDGYYESCVLDPENNQIELVG